MVQNNGCLDKNVIRNEQFTANYSLDVYLTLSHSSPTQELKILFCGLAYHKLQSTRIWPSHGEREHCRKLAVYRKDVYNIN